MKIRQLYESKIQFGGLHYNYKRFDVGDKHYNFIYFNGSSGMPMIHLSNYQSTPASTEEITEPKINYESINELHAVIKKSFDMSRSVIPDVLKSKELVYLYLLRTDDLDSLEKDMEKFQTKDVPVEYKGRTRFGGENYCEFEVVFKPE